MQKFLKNILFCCVILFLGISLTGCHQQKNSTQSKKNNQIKVVATTNFYGQIAKEILGDHGKVTSIIDSPNIDPHDFTPTVSTAKNVAKGDLVIYNGVGYDTWVKRLQGKKYLSVSELVHVKDGANEHLWYDPTYMGTLVNALVKQYSQLLPQYANDFKKNGKNYKQQLSTLQNKINQIKKLKHNDKVAVSEPAFNYALKAMGFEIIDDHFSLAIEEGSDPSYTDIAKLQDAIKNHKIAFFVLNKQSDSKLVDNIAKLCRKENVPIVKVTETMPSNDSYINWFNQELDQVLKIVQNQ